MENNRDLLFKRDDVFLSNLHNTIDKIRGFSVKAQIDLEYLSIFIFEIKSLLMITSSYIDGDKLKDILKIFDENYNFFTSYEIYKITPNYNKILKDWNMGEEDKKTFEKIEKKKKEVFDFWEKINKEYSLAGVTPKPILLNRQSDSATNEEEKEFLRDLEIGGLI